MAKQLQIRGGTTVQHSTFTGALREITIDTDKDVVVVHDGTTAGGFPLAKQTSVDSKVTKVASTGNAVVRFNGVTGEVKNSGVIIDDNNNLGLNTTPYSRLDLGVGSTGLSQISWHLNSTTSYNNIWSSRGGASTIIGCGIKGSSSVDNGFESSVGIAWAKSAIAIASGSIKFYTDALDTVSYGTAYTPTERMRIDNSGNLLLISGTGALGYGVGAGGSVTQLTSKSTSVTLNKPTGKINTHNSALGAGASIEFAVNNNLYNANNGDVVVVSAYSFGISYRIEQIGTGIGSFAIRVTNITGGSLSDPIAINFTIIKGSNS